VAALGALGEFDALQNDALTQLFITLKNSEAGHESSGITLVGHLLARTQSDVGAGRAVLGLLNTNPDAPFAREEMREAEAAFARVHAGARLAEEAERSFLAQDEIDVLNENLRIVAQEQQRLADLAKTQRRRRSEMGPNRQSPAGHRFGNPQPGRTDGAQPPGTPPTAEGIVCAISRSN
jgi:hypothetical protein